MDFEQTLNHYINVLDISCKNLSDASGLTPPVVNRYINGKRIPQDNSPQLNALINGIYKLSLNKPELNITLAELNKSLRMSIQTKNIEYDIFIQRLTILWTSLNINIKHMSTEINFDLSFLYRIKSGNTRPRNISEFAGTIAGYIANNYTSASDRKIISSITGDEKLKDINSVYSSVYTFLLLPPNAMPNKPTSLMQRVDKIEMFSQFNTSADFEKIPKTKTKLTVFKTVYDYENIQRLELDFFINTLQAENKNNDVFLMSDMKNKVLSSTPGYNERWLYALSCLIKKRMNIKIIVDPNVPMKERSQSIKNWLPLYITGHVIPYKINNYKSTVFAHVLFLSDKFSLIGEGLLSKENCLRYTLSNKKNEMNFCRALVDDIMQNVTPLIREFKYEDQEAYINFLIKAADVDAPRHNILCAPPLYTLSFELAKEILDYNQIDKNEQHMIMDFLEKHIEALEPILNNCEITDSFPVIEDEEKFNSSPVSLSISELPISKPIYYSFEQYKKHLQLTRDTEKKYTNYKTNTINTFFNKIDIHIFKNQFAAFNKNSFPTSRFVIEDKKIVECLDKMEF